RGNRAWVLRGDARRIFPQAKKIGSGYFCHAYRLGYYVIKQAHWRRCPRTKLLLVGFEIPQQWYMNGWVVQVYYKLAPARLIDERAERGDITYSKALDLGYGNTGINDDGRLVSFDW